MVRQVKVFYNIMKLNEWLKEKGEDADIVLNYAAARDEVGCVCPVIFAEYYGNGEDEIG